MEGPSSFERQLRLAKKGWIYSCLLKSRLSPFPEAFSPPFSKKTVKMSTGQKSLPPFTFRVLFLLQTKLVARKQRRCAEKASAGKEFCPEILLGFRRMGRAARAPGRAPLHRKTPIAGERMACPP